MRTILSTIQSTIPGECAGGLRRALAIGLACAAFGAAAQPVPKRRRRSASFLTTAPNSPASGRCPQHPGCLSARAFRAGRPADILVGRQIVEVLTPFLIHLLDPRLAKATFSRHRDNLWALGGELIRCRCDDDELAKSHVKDALRQLTQGDGGPLMWLRFTEAEQDSLDATRGQAESLLARIGCSGPIRLTQRLAFARASRHAAQSCPHRRAVGACDEPTDRRGWTTRLGCSGPPQTAHK